MNAVVFWSGGKDCCFSLYLAKLAGINIKYLLNFIALNGYCFSHKLSAKLLEDQMKLTGINFLQIRTTKERYGDSFKKTLRMLKKQGINCAVFGDIHLEEHRQWIEARCNEVKIRPLFPLWGKDTYEIAERFIKEGFSAIIVKIDPQKLKHSYLLKIYSSNLIQELKAGYIDPCGEEGEFHTLVIAGPLFKGRIILKEVNLLNESIEIISYSINFNN